WAIAYASQARSDWELYETLQACGEPRCHQLHYLQMASEKRASGIWVGRERGGIEVEPTAVEQDRVTKAGSAPVPTGPLLERLDLRIHRLEVRVRDAEHDGVDDA